MHTNKKICDGDGRDDAQPVYVILACDHHPYRIFMAPLYIIK